MILKIVKAGCHPVAIAQVVSTDSLSQRPPVQSRVAAGFSQFLKKFRSLFKCMYVMLCAPCLSVGFGAGGGYEGEEHGHVGWSNEYHFCHCVVTPSLPLPLSLSPCLPPSLRSSFTSSLPSSSQSTRHLSDSET